MNTTEETNVQEDVPDEDEVTTHEEKPSSQVEETQVEEASPPTEQEDKNRSTISKLKSEMEQIEKLEGKLPKAIELMEAALSQSGSPDFRTFWDARKLCLELFKGDIPPAIRAIHWLKYRELTKEARRLKEIFEEQTAFAVEQIDIAIQAVEKDLGEMDRQVEKVPSPEFPKSCRVLKGNLDRYCSIQRKLRLLNNHAARINGLRKELIRTEIRIKQKNKFFQRLSVAGDSVFPRRKQLIKEVSQLFIDDVDGFYKENFSGSKLGSSLFSLREEIKNLQAAAKLLTLNTHAFTHARMQLSECWEKLKQEDKELKKARGELKETHKKNEGSVQTKINEINDSLQKGEIPIDEAQKQLDGIFKSLHSLDLGRDELRALREELNKAQKPIRDKKKEDEKKRREQILEKEQNRQKKIRDIEEQLEALKSDSQSYDLEALRVALKNIQHELKQLDLSDFERDSLQRCLIPAQDVFLEKEEERLLKLPDGVKEALTQLNKVLLSRQQRRDEIKEQIEKYRKACGSSGLDFEQSMHFNEQLNVEKMRLEKINQSIEQVEAKVAELKSKG